MSYSVYSHGFDADGRPAPAAIDPNFSSVEEALAHACTLLSRGVPNIAIRDGNGKSISGDDLAACCRGEKKLTSDLKTIAI